MLKSNIDYAVEVKPSSRAGRCIGALILEKKLDGLSVRVSRLEALIRPQPNCQYSENIPTRPEKQKQKVSPPLTRSDISNTQKVQTWIPDF